MSGYRSYPEIPSIAQRPDQARAAHKFNDFHTVGTLVRYWEHEKIGEPTGIARTSTHAYLFGNTVAAVLLEGVAAAIPLANLEVIS